MCLFRVYIVRRGPLVAWGPPSHDHSVEARMFVVQIRKLTIQIRVAHCGLGEWRIYQHSSSPRTDMLLLEWKKWRRIKKNEKKKEREMKMK